MSAALELAVCGLHMSGGALNHQMVSAGAELVRAARTAAHYTLHAVGDAQGRRLKPALLAHPGGGGCGAGIAVEVWRVPVGALGALFRDSIGAQGARAPLAFGVVDLADGAAVPGFVGLGWAGDEAACAAAGLTTRDITRFGGWREWRAAVDGGE